MRQANLRAGWFLLSLLAVPLLLNAQEPAGNEKGKINLQIPPPPPPEATESAEVPSRRPIILPVMRPVAPAPEHIVIDSGTRFEVVLDTPLSTRISKKGDGVTFLTIEPVDLDDGLVIPRNTRILGTVVKAKRPGLFGRPGALRVRVNRIELATGGSGEITGRLDSPDPSVGQVSSDSTGAADLYALGMWTLQGTLLGSRIKGGKGAAIGAGAGAATALIILMSRRSRDVYLEPGMPFTVDLDSPAELAGIDVMAAQPRSSAGQTSARAPSDHDPLGGTPYPAGTQRPKLKRRPKNR
jgi:hypothetical protein